MPEINMSMFSAIVVVSFYAQFIILMFQRVLSDIFCLRLCTSYSAQYSARVACDQTQCATLVKFGVLTAAPARNKPLRIEIGLLVTAVRQTV
jgi:hypothetical protein